ncbi:hypothetical protein ACFY2T_15695 [Streptomyces sp. NPDC001260]|uniref:hypothetical protein n=1 Tax=Streptomyces sp. NPDC001260 TaxID=3364551 RepID=UPI0036B96960
MDGDRPAHDAGEPWTDGPGGGCQELRRGAGAVLRRGPDRARLADLVRRVRDGRLEVRVGAVRPLPEAAAAFAPEERVSGRTIIRVAED